MDWSRFNSDPLSAQAESIERSREFLAGEPSETASSAQSGPSQINQTAFQADLISQNNPTTPSSTTNLGKLYAISDIHLSYPTNSTFWASLIPHPSDGLILAGDIGESNDHLELAFSLATQCFKTVWWVPGNHELYSVSRDLTQTRPATEKLRGEAKYARCVEVARQYGVYTPEDAYVLWEGIGGPVLIAPVFTLYDYTFAPDNVAPEDAVAWAMDAGVLASDEKLLHADPYTSKPAWCVALVDKFTAKLEAAREAYPDSPLVLVNHWPLRRDTLTLFKYPEFAIWCGTRRTEEWYARFNAAVVVTGHVHLRRTDWRRRGEKWTRFEEVSLGYPREWQGVLGEKGVDVNGLLREIWPGEMPPKSGLDEMRFRKFG